MSTLHEVTQMLTDRAMAGDTPAPARAKVDDPQPEKPEYRRSAEELADDLRPDEAAPAPKTEKRIIPEDAFKEPVTDEGNDEPDVTLEGEEAEQDGSDTTEEAETPDEEQTPDPETVELDDTYAVTVPIDGVDKEVSLRDLVDTYAKTGAADKRLQDASESFKEAKVSRDSAAQDAETLRTSMVAILQQLDGTLHTPTIQAPSETLKSSNPSAYIRQMDAYNNEMQAINKSRDELKAAFAQQGQLIQQAKDNTAREQFRILKQRLAPLRNEATEEQAVKDIQAAAKRFGFSEAEVASGADARMYEMAYYAQQYLNQQSGETKIRAQKATMSGKTLRSGRTSLKSAKTQQKNRVVKLKAQAQKTGKPADIAAYLSERQKG